jgi:hypothetical protein
MGPGTYHCRQRSTLVFVILTKLCLGHHARIQEDTYNIEYAHLWDGRSRCWCYCLHYCKDSWLLVPLFRIIWSVLRPVDLKDFIPLSYGEISCWYLISRVMFRLTYGARSEAFTFSFAPFRNLFLVMWSGTSSIRCDYRPFFFFFKGAMTWQHQAPVANGEQGDSELWE